MRKVHGRFCREQDTNLLLHLQHLSEELDCKDEWMFVESRSIEEYGQHICLCGQTEIENYFFLENKINGNRTYVGSECIENIDSQVGKVVAYFQYILARPIEGKYVGTIEGGLELFAVSPNTNLVTGSKNIVNHVNPQVVKNGGEKWEALVKHLNPQLMKDLKVKYGVLVKYSKPETLVQGQSYTLRLKASYMRGELTFTAV